MSELRRTQKQLYKFFGFLGVFVAVVEVVAMASKGYYDWMNVLSWELVLMAILLAFLYVEHIMFYTSELSTKVKKQ